jgi:hypothetical protein
MKLNIIIAAASALLFNCNDNPSAQAANPKENNSQPEAIAKQETVERADDGITGYWKLKLEAYDNNENKMLDEAERKKGVQNHYSFRFNADGSCTIRESFKGRYEVKTKGGNKILSIYRDRLKGDEEKGPPPDIYRIISLSKDELVLLEQEEEMTFWIFERAN